MKAVCWFGKNDVRVEHVPEPEILNPHDAVIKITSTAICGSDLHLYDGYIPTMKQGDILGHEFMGEVVQVGTDVTNIKPGDRVVVPFTISCGQCFFCQRQLWSLCDNTNPNAGMANTVYGHSPAGIYGYSHLMGGYAGGQAEYVRVPFANIGPLKIPDGIPDEKVLFISDVLATAYMAAENGGILPGDTVAVWGCGPVGLLTLQCAALLGAARLIAIDRVPERLETAHTRCNAETINDAKENVLEVLNTLTGGQGPDVCIEAVGMEAHGRGLTDLYDRAAQKVRLQTGRPTALRQAIIACRKGGNISVAGVFGGFVDKIPMGAAFNKSLSFKMGQTHVPRYMQLLLNHIMQNTLDPSFIITHTLPLEEAPWAYEIFKHKEDGCIKVVLKPS